MAWPQKTRSSAQGNCSAKSLVPQGGEGGYRGGYGGGGTGRGVRGGQGTFHPPCQIQHYHMVLALKGLRTINPTIFCSESQSPTEIKVAPPTHTHTILDAPETGERGTILCLKNPKFPSTAFAERHAFTSDPAPTSNCCRQLLSSTQQKTPGCSGDSTHPCHFNEQN